MIGCASRPGTSTLSTWADSSARALLIRPILPFPAPERPRWTSAPTPLRAPTISFCSFPQSVLAPWPRRKPALVQVDGEGAGRGPHPHRGPPRLWRAAQLRSGGAVSPLHVFPGWCIGAPITVFDYTGPFNAAMLTRSPTLIVEIQEFYNQNFQVPEGPPDHRVRRGTAKVLREQIEMSGSRALKKWRLPK